MIGHLYVSRRNKYTNVVKHFNESHDRDIGSLGVKVIGRGGVEGGGAG